MTALRDIRYFSAFSAYYPYIYIEVLCWNRKKISHIA